MKQEEFMQHLDFISAELQHKVEDNEFLRAEIEEYFEDYKQKVNKNESKKINKTSTNFKPRNAYKSSV